MGLYGAPHQLVGKLVVFCPRINTARRVSFAVGSRHLSLGHGHALSNGEYYYWCHVDLVYDRNIYNFPKEARLPAAVLPLSYTRHERGLLLTNAHQGAIGRRVLKSTTLLTPEK